ncbi:MAG: ATP-binding protein [Pseudomonadota bacterium]
MQDSTSQSETGWERSVLRRQNLLIVGLVAAIGCAGWLTARAAGEFQPDFPATAWMTAGLLVVLLVVALAFTVGLAQTRSEAQRLITARTLQLERARKAEKENSERLAVLLEDLTTAKRLSEEDHAEKKQLLGAITSILIGLDARGAVTKWNRVAAANFGIKEADVLGQPVEECGVSWDIGELQAALEECRDSGNPVKRQLTFTEVNGDEGTVGITINAVTTDDNEVSGFLILGANITQRLRADQDRLALEMQLRQAQKLESIGRLAAGIAHEINTPTQFVGDNIRFLSDAFDDVFEVIRRHTELLEAAAENKVTPEIIEAAREAADKADIEFLSEDVPQAISQSIDGTKRIAGIVAAMKAFSHPGGNQREVVDINQAIENTVTVASNEWKYVADVKLELDDTVPMVPCHPQEFNQVVLNLVVNAAHAIGDTEVVTEGGKGTITVSSKAVDDMLEVRIADTGSGIPLDVRDKIFDPFFTTKEVGRGTGQGLAIAHAAIVEKHGGSLDFESELGEGTVFIIRIPLEVSQDAQERTAA